MFTCYNIYSTCYKCLFIQTSNKAHNQKIQADSAKLVCFEMYKAMFYCSFNLATTVFEKGKINNTQMIIEYSRLEQQA